MNRPKQKKTPVLLNIDSCDKQSHQQPIFSVCFMLPPKGYHSSLVGVVVRRQSVVVAFAFSVVEGSYPDSQDGGVVVFVIVMNFVGRSQRGGGIQ